MTVVGCVRAGSSTRLLHLCGLGCLPRAGFRFSCLTGLALALQRWHWHQRMACIAGRWGWCLACIDEAFGRMTHEWCSACVVRLDPCLSSDVLTRMPSQSWRKRNSGLFEVGFLCFIPNAQALLRTISCLSPLAFCVSGEPKAAVVSHAFRALACDGLVRD